LFFSFGKTRVYKNAATNAPTPTNTPPATCRADAAPVWVALAEAAVPVAPELVAALPVMPALPLAGAEDTGVMIEVVALPTETTIMEVLLIRTVLKPEERAGMVAGSGCEVTTLGWIVTTAG
jgi:hypothetical protein